MHHSLANHGSNGELSHLSKDMTFLTRKKNGICLKGWGGMCVLCILVLFVFKESFRTILDLRNGKGITVLV